MNCNNCGNVLPDIAKFCDKCGAKQQEPAQNVMEPAQNVMEPSQNVMQPSQNVMEPAQNVMQPSQNVMQPSQNIVANTQNENGMMKPKKKFNPKLFGILAVVAVIIFAAIFIINKKARTVNLNDYITVEFHGYDTVGYANAYFDREAFTKKYSDKIKTKLKKDEFSYLTDTPLDDLIYELEYEFDRSMELSNGDEINLVWDIDADIIKKKYGLIVKTETKKFTVSDLEEIEVIDPFEELEVVFEGVSPNGTVELYETMYNNQFGESLNYTIDKETNLSNDDIITITISYAESEENFKKIFGEVLKFYTKEYTVSGLEEYMKTDNESLTEVVSEIKDKAEKSIETNFDESYNEEVDLGELSYEGYIYTSAKSDSDNDFYNNIYLIYSGKVSNSENKFSEETIFFPVKYSNITIKDDIIKYDEANGIEGSVQLDGDTNVINGYMNPFLCYEELFSKNEKEYDVSCGDGFEKYETCQFVTEMNQLSEEFRVEKKEEAKTFIERYIENDYSEMIEVDEFEYIGEYLLVATDQDQDFTKRNQYIIVYAATLSSTDNEFEPIEVFYPILYNGIINFEENKTLVTQKLGLQGLSKVEFLDQTKGYLDEAEMFEKIITKNIDDYTFEIAGDLTQFEE